MDPAETNSICELEGTEITTEAKIDPPLPSVTWVITEKLRETSFFRYQGDADDDLGYPYAAAKFLCYPKGDPAKTPAFLRIYQQIPITGTENSRLSIRVKQATTQSTNELEILKELMQKDCKVVPKLLGYQEAQQDHDNIIPSGFITYVVWEKVPGVTLSKQYIWSQTPEVRDDMRKEFRRVYQDLVLCGIQPIPPHERKLIYDKSTGKMHISGFQMGLFVDSNENWSEINYVLYGLVRPLNKDWSQERDWQW